MKKNLIRLTACAAAAACVLSFAACSSNGKTVSSAAAGSEALGLPASSAAESSQAASSSEAAVSSEAADGKTASGKYATVEDFVNSDSMQKQLESMKSSLSGEGMTIDVTGEGDKLIYTFTYTEDLGEDQIESVSAALESALEQMSGTFEGVASSLKAAVEVESPVVVVAYVAADGTELCSREFAPAE